MPVIDDPLSMIRCTNKVYLNELIGHNKVPVPPTVMIAEDADLDKASDELGFPLVLKIPDGSFSRGVNKVETPRGAQALADELFEDTDLLIAQKFMPTEFDWRVGVLGGEPLFVVPVPHGARALADRQTPARRLVARGRLPRLRPRPGAARGDRHRGACCAADRRRASTASTSSRPTTASSSWRSTTTQISTMASRMPVGKDEVWMRLPQWFLERFEQ